MSNSNFFLKFDVFLYLNCIENFERTFKFIVHPICQYILKYNIVKTMKRIQSRSRINVIIRISSKQFYSINFIIILPWWNQNLLNTLFDKSKWQHIYKTQEESCQYWGSIWSIIMLVQSHFLSWKSVFCYHRDFKI